MRLPIRTLAAFAGVALLPEAAAAQVPLPAPNKGWVLDYGETACMALRTFASPEGPVTFALRPAPSGEVVRLALARRDKTGFPVHFPVRVTIGGAVTRLSGLRFASSDGKMEIVWINVRRPVLDSLPSAGAIALEGAEITRTLRLPGIAAVLKGLDECNADLRAHWNVAGAGVPLATPAAPLRPLPSYFVDSDYPRQAVEEGRGGVARVMMMVDETGKLRDCLVEETSGVATLDAMGCLVLMQRAKFKPARDAAGRPVKSVLTNRIRWEMP